MSDPRAVIIDTDCGLGGVGAKVDDAFALALAVASPEIDVHLVTTTAGNVDLLTATTRTKALLERLGHGDVPVEAGACPDGTSAARSIVTRALADPGAVTLVSLAPLTTVACALESNAGLAGALHEIVAMAGRFAGPPGAPAEFNTRADPWALRTVLQSGVHLRLVGLDVTERLALSPAELERLDRGDHRARYLSGQARSRLATLAGDGVRRCPMHDPLAVLAVTHPDLLVFEASTVTVEVAAGARHGVTTAHRAGGNPVEPTSWIATDVDAAAATEVLVGRLAGL